MKYDGYKIWLNIWIFSNAQSTQNRLWVCERCVHSGVFCFFWNERKMTHTHAHNIHNIHIIHRHMRCLNLTLKLQILQKPLFLLCLFFLVSDLFARKKRKNPCFPFRNKAQPNEAYTDSSVSEKCAKLKNLETMKISKVKNPIHVLLAFKCLPSAAQQVELSGLAIRIPAPEWSHTFHTHAVPVICNSVTCLMSWIIAKCVMCARRSVRDVSN